MNEKDPKEYRFLEEETKDPPKDRKKFIRRLGTTILLAAVFGVVACLTFYLLKPAVQRLAENMQQETASDTAEDLSEDSPEGEVTLAEESGETSASEGEDDGSDEESELTLEDYENFQKELYAVGKSADSSVVIIESVTSQKDWFEDDYETTGEGTGIIIEKTSGEVLILTDRSLIEDASEISVTFYGGSSQSAQMEGYDAATGIALLSVARKDLDSGTDERIEAVDLDNTTGIRQGMSVIGIGSPLGAARSVIVGTVTSVSNEISVTDANYRLLATDITAESGAGGVLLNASGEAIGLICRDVDSETLQAYVISELSDLISRLADGQNTVQLGVKISEVTQSIAEEYDLPEGVYVKEVEADSPAADAGIQVGDVITKAGGTEVASESAFEDVMLGITKSQTLSITVMRQDSSGEYQSVTCRAKIEIE